jgi:predicted hydrolase (HD superfamily)
MEGYAKKNGLSEEEIDSYWITGLLHDFDYERYPSLEKHPYEGVKVLKEEGYTDEIVQAIFGHGNHTGVKRESVIAKTLFAVDELSGLVVALAHVRPGNFDGMTAKSVKKALKKKDFAKGVNRGDIRQGIEELGVEQCEHFEAVIEALNGIKSDLGF